VRRVHITQQGARSPCAGGTKYRDVPTVRAMEMATMKGDLRMDLEVLDVKEEIDTPPHLSIGSAREQIPRLSEVWMLRHSS